MNTPCFFAGLDIGKQHDHSALAALELRTRKAGFDPVYWVPIIEWDLRVRRLTRSPLGTSYRDLIDSVEREMRTPAFGVDTPLVVDATGVGDAIIDLLRGSAIPLVPVILTGGEHVTHSGGRFRVPKHHRVSVSGRPSYGAFRDNAHDDLVIAVALAAWCCRYTHPDPGRIRLPPPLMTPSLPKYRTPREQTKRFPANLFLPGSPFRDDSRAVVQTTNGAGGPAPQ